MNNLLLRRRALVGMVGKGGEDYGTLIWSQNLETTVFTPVAKTIENDIVTITTEPHTDTTSGTFSIIVLPTFNGTTNLPKRHSNGVSIVDSTTLTCGDTFAYGDTIDFNTFKLGRRVALANDEIAGYDVIDIPDGTVLRLICNFWTDDFPSLFVGGWKTVYIYDRSEYNSKLPINSGITFRDFDITFIPHRADGTIEVLSFKVKATAINNKTLVDYGELSFSPYTASGVVNWRSALIKYRWASNGTISLYKVN